MKYRTAIASAVPLLLLSSPAHAAMSPILKDQLFIATIGLVIVVLALLLGAVFKSHYDLSMAGKIRKYSGIAILSIGFYIMVGAFTNPLKVRANEDGSNRWLKSEATCVAKGAREKRPVLLDFWGRHCKPCIKMINNTFSNKQVLEKLKGFVLCKVDMDAEQNQHLWKKYGFSELPAVLFITSSGVLNRKKSVRQYMGPEAFIKHLEDVDVVSDGSESNMVSDWMADKGLFLTILLIFAAGFMTSLTPCVYPLIPITINVIGASNKQESRWHGFLLSLTYVGGLVLMYSSLGLIAALTGGSIGKFAQNRYLIGGIVVLFVAMGSSFLGLFTLELPSSWSTRLSEKGGKGFAGAFVVGLVSGFIAAPCVGPVLLAILAWVAQDGNPVKGFGLMFVFALGLGTLFIVIGTFTDVAKRLPRSGPWMDSVKVLFAVSFFVLALYYLNSIVPPMESLFHGLQQLNPLS